MNESSAWSLAVGYWLPPATRVRGLHRPQHGGHTTRPAEVSLSLFNPAFASSGESDVVNTSAETRLISHVHTTPFLSRNSRASVIIIGNGSPAVPPNDSARVRDHLLHRAGQQLDRVNSVRGSN